MRMMVKYFDLLLMMGMPERSKNELSADDNYMGRGPAVLALVKPKVNVVA